MKAVLTLKPVTDKKGNVWQAGQIIGLPPKDADTFVAAKNGLDLAATNFATAALPDNSAAPVKVPASADFSLATVGLKSNANGTGSNPGSTPVPTPITVAYTIASSVDATDLLTWNFVASPTAQPGTYKFGDGSANVNSLNGEASYTYANAGTYTVTFIPVDGNKAATTSITVEAPAPVDTTPADATPV